MPHRGIRYGPGQVSVGHHPQDVEVFDAYDPAGSRQFGGELVLDIPADVGNLLMLARHLEPLLLIVLAKNGSLGFRVFGLLFLTEFALQFAEFLQIECQRPLVLKPSSIRNHSRLLYAHIHPDHSFRRF